MADLTSLKRKRGSVKASITKLNTRLTELEDGERDPSSISHAQLLLKKLEKLDSEFRTHHFATIEAVESDELAAAEQEELDSHDDTTMSLQVRLQTLLAPSTDPTVLTTDPAHTPAPPPSTSDGQVLADRRLQQLEARMSLVSNAITKLAPHKDIHLADLHAEQLGEFKRELAEIRNDVIEESSDALMLKVQSLDRLLFESSVTVKQILYSSTTTGPFPPPTSLAPTLEPQGVKLPRIDVPTFNGELLNWNTFWEQLCVAIHDRKNLSATEKLVYLRHALKDGSAKSIIEGLSATGDQYPEAIASLKARYDRPILLHQTHVRKIYELPNVKEGTGKELRKFHDVAQQHLRALKSMGKEPSGPFITSLLELKLDQTTLFEWQKFSQSLKDVPAYPKLLDFLNLWAQASESVSPEKKSLRSETRKQYSNGKHIQSLTAVASPEPTPCCVVCKTEKHPLYACQQFKLLPHDKMLAVVRNNSLCLNCLRPGHI